MKRLSYILVTAVMAFALIGCGSDSGGGGGNAPSIPDFDKSQPDFSYFQGTAKTSTSAPASPNFSDAQSTVLGFSSITYIGQIYSPFVQNAQSSNAQQNNGVWVWEYNYSYQGSTASIRLEAEDATNGTFWDMFYTFSSQGLSFNDYNMVSGFVNTDGTSGDWTFNTIFDDGGTEKPLIESIWEAPSNDQLTIDITIFDSQGQAEEVINYTQNGSQHTLVISSLTTVFWDTDAQEGYYDPPQGQRVCWTGNASSSTDVACSTLGF